MDKKVKDAVAKEKVRRVVDAMRQEGIVLDDETNEMLYDCFNGKMTFEEARSRIYRKFKGSKTNDK